MSKLSISRYKNAGKKRYGKVMSKKREPRDRINNYVNDTDNINTISISYSL